MRTYQRPPRCSASLPVRAGAACHLLFAIWLSSCGNSNASTEDDESLNQRRLAGSEAGNPPHSDTDEPSPCDAATSASACARIEGCAWTECPPNADCAVAAWCAASEAPAHASRTCEAAGNEIECRRLRSCQWFECPPNADCQAPAWCAAPEDSCPSGGAYELRRSGSEVLIPSSYRACRVDADCTLVATGCNGCCQQDAIARALERTYAENFRAACADYVGAECDCESVPGEAQCVDGACTFVPASR